MSRDRQLRRRVNSSSPGVGDRGRRGRSAESAAPTPVGQVRHSRRGERGTVLFVGDVLGEAKTRDGNVEAIRVLRLARNSAKRDRTRALNQMRALIATAPDELRSQLRGLTIPRLVRAAAGFRPGGRTDVPNANRAALPRLLRGVCWNSMPRSTCSTSSSHHSSLRRLPS